MKLHDETGRELRRVYVTTRGPEAQALLQMIQDAARGVDRAREADARSDFMFVLDSTGTEHPSGGGES
jgi:hypothetical protein